MRFSVVFLSICLSLCLSICLSLSLSICLSLCLSVCLSPELHASEVWEHIFVLLSFCVCVFQSVFLSLCFFVIMSFCLSVFLSLRLSVFQSVTLYFCCYVLMSLCLSYFLSFCLSQISYLNFTLQKFGGIVKRKLEVFESGHFGKFIQNSGADVILVSLREKNTNLQNKFAIFLIKLKSLRPGIKTKFCQCQFKYLFSQFKFQSTPSVPIQIDLAYNRGLGPNLVKSQFKFLFSICSQINYQGVVRQQGFEVVPGFLGGNLSGTAFQLG